MQHSILEGILAEDNYKLAKDLKDIFLKDLDNCTELTTEFFDNQSSWLKFKQYFSRLLSPTL